MEGGGPGGGESDGEVAAGGVAGEPTQARRAPAIVARRSEGELVDAVGHEAGFLEGFVALEDGPLRLEGYQAAFLRNRARMRWVTKARQVGFSFVIALEALARCHLRANYTAHIVSFSLAEAKEKILLARRAYESLPLGVRKELVTDSKTELGFSSAGGVSRIVVHPSKAPRGRTGDIYLDELAHYVDAREVYAGATPLVLRSRGQLTGCSTPLGPDGIFHEIAVPQDGKYERHSRQVVPWYLCSFFCKDIGAAAREVPYLPTVEAVERFGTAALIEQFEGIALEDFEQEFGCVFVDSSHAFLSYDLILGCTADLELADAPADLPRPEGRLVAGYDVGRVRDHSVLSVFEDRDGRWECRMLKRIAGVRFDEQEGQLRHLLTTVPLARLSIDQSGLGRHLVENLQRDFPHVQAEDFTNAAKERWATYLRILLQRKHVLLPRDRRLVADFHAIKRKVLPSGKVAFDADRTVDGHADGFWSVALAVQRDAETGSATGATVGVRILEGSSSLRRRPLFPDAPDPDEGGQ